MEKQHLPPEITGERIILKKHSLDLAETLFRYVDRDRERLRLFLPWVDSTTNVENEYILFPGTMSSARWDIGYYEISKLNFKIAHDRWTDYKTNTKLALQFRHLLSN